MRPWTGEHPLCWGSARRARAATEPGLDWATLAPGDDTRRTRRTRGTDRAPLREGTPPLSAARQRVLDAAAKLFSRRGFSGTSMQDIADALGIRKPSLYKHFTSKDELYSAVLQQALKPFSAAIDQVLQAEGPGQNPRALSATSLRILDDNPDVSHLLLQELIQLDRPIHPELGQWLELLFAQADGVVALEGRADLGPVERRLLLLTQLNVVLGFAVAKRLLPGNVDSEDRFGLERDILEKVVAALYGTSSQHNSKLRSPGVNAG